MSGHLRLVSSRFWQTIRRFQPTVVHIEQPGDPQARNSVGEEVPNWATVPGLERLHCTFAPVAIGRDAEKRKELHREGYTIVSSTRDVLLDGPYPAIQPPMRLVIDEGGHPGDGRVWNIAANQIDELSIVSRLAVEVVRV